MMLRLGSWTQLDCLGFQLERPCAMDANRVPKVWDDFPVLCLQLGALVGQQRSMNSFAGR